MVKFGAAFLLIFFGFLSTQIQSARILTTISASSTAINNMKSENSSSTSSTVQATLKNDFNLTNSTANIS
jgi:hypothetical protein